MAYDREKAAAYREKNRERIRAYSRDWKKGVRWVRKKASFEWVAGGRFDYDLQRRYGITAKQYREMFEAQHGTCAICRQDRKLHVDHDHETNVVRGLLCMPCNTAIGHLNHDQELLLKAVSYLQLIAK
jgi:hypothetical protein